MKIGWYTDAKINPPSDLFVIEPVRLSDFQTNLGVYKHCPAFSNYINQTYVLKSPFDLELSYENAKVIVTNSSLDRSEYENNLTVNLDNRPVVQLELHVGLVSDKPCFVEIFGSFFNEDTKNEPFRVIPGTYDIFSWQRFLNFAFEWIYTQDKVVIKRGQPLLYLRFRGENLNEKFQMIRIEMTDDLFASIKRCQSSKLFLKGKSWSLIPVNRLLRKKKKFIV